MSKTTPPGRILSPQETKKQSGYFARYRQFIQKQNLLGKAILLLLPVCFVCFACSFIIAIFSPPQTPTAQDIGQKRPVSSRQTPNTPEPTGVGNAPLVSSLTSTKRATRTPQLPGVETPSINETDIASHIFSTLTARAPNLTVAETPSVDETEIAARIFSTLTASAPKPIGTEISEAALQSPTFAATSTPESATAATMLGIVNTNANVRDAPSTSGRLLTTLKKGQQVEVQARNQAGDWLQIAQGWILGKLVDLQGDASLLSIAEARVLVTSTSAPEPVEAADTPTESITEPTAVPTHPPVQAPSFGGGMKIVGADIPPGTYRSAGGSECYWERLSGFGGTLEEIIANDNAVGPTIVTIAATDKGFDSERCGVWKQDLSPITDSPTAAFGEGIFIVNGDIAPGTWRSSGGESCYWARLSGFSGQFDDIIANDNATGPTVVTINESDAGFESSRCGTWTKIQ